MSIVTRISLVPPPGSEPAPAPRRRRVQLAPSPDGRAAVTLVSWLVGRAAPAGAADPRGRAQAPLSASA